MIHRIIGGDAASGFQTKGDSNSEPDEWRPLPTDILGAARWRIPLLGRLLSVLRSTPGIALIAGLLASLLVLFGLGGLSIDAPDANRTPLRFRPSPSIRLLTRIHSTTSSRRRSPSRPCCQRTPTRSTTSSLRLATDDDEVVGEYWGDDLGYLKGCCVNGLRNRSCSTMTSKR